MNLSSSADSTYKEAFEPLLAGCHDVSCYLSRVEMELDFMTGWVAASIYFKSRPSDDHMKTSCKRFLTRNSLIGQQINIATSVWKWKILSLLIFVKVKRLGTEFRTGLRAKPCGHYSATFSFTCIVLRLRLPSCLILIMMMMSLQPGEGEWNLENMQLLSSNNVCMGQIHKTAKRETCLLLNFF